MALGAVLLAGILYYLDATYGLGKTLDVNRTDIMMIGYCAVGFCFIWILMDKWFLKPYLSLIERREELTSGAEATAKQKEEELQEILEQYEVKLLEARMAAVKKKQESVQSAKAESNRKIEEAKLQAEAKIAEARRAISEKKSRMQMDVQKEAEALAGQMVDKVMNMGNLQN